MNLVEFHSLRYFALRLPPILLEWADCKGICAHSSDLLVQDIGSDWLHVAITFSAFVSLALAWQRRHPFWAQRRRAAIPKLPFSMVLTSIWRTLNNIFCSFNLRSLTVVPGSWSTGCMFLSEFWDVHSPSFATRSVSHMFALSWFSCVICCVSLVSSSSNTVSFVSRFWKMDATLLLDVCYFSSSCGGAMWKERKGEGKSLNNDVFVVISWIFHRFGVHVLSQIDAADTKDTLSLDVGIIHIAWGTFAQSQLFVVFVSPLQHLMVSPRTCKNVECWEEEVVVVAKSHNPHC